MWHYKSKLETLTLNLTLRQTGGSSHFFLFSASFLVMCHTNDCIVICRKHVPGAGTRIKNLLSVRNRSSGIKILRIQIFSLSRYTYLSVSGCPCCYEFDHTGERGSSNLTAQLLRPINSHVFATYMIN